jgi:hypothetical protein
MDSKPPALLTIVAVISTTLAASYIVVAPVFCIKLAVVSFLALAGWMRFSFREPGSQDTIVAPYILVVLLNLVLNTGRYWSHHAQYLNENIHAIFAPHFAVTDVSWFIVSVTCPVSLMLLGGYYLSKRASIGFYLAWWTFLYSIVDAIVQSKLEFLSSGTYHHEYFGSPCLTPVMRMVSPAAAGCIHSRGSITWSP